MSELNSAAERLKQWEVDLASFRTPGLSVELSWERFEDLLTVVDGVLSKAPKRFKRPTVEEVEAYCKSSGHKVDAANFVDFYESKGWKVGSTSMKCWKAAVRTWARKQQNEQSAGFNRFSSQVSNPARVKAKPDKFEAEEVIDLTTESGQLF